MLIISQASAKPEQLVQDSLESKFNAITMRDPPSITHVSRFLDEILSFATEAPSGVIPPHKIEDKVLGEIAKVEAMQSDYVQSLRLPWSQR